MGAWALEVLGSAHIFIAAPLTFPVLSEQVFWFVGAGLAFWYAGAINLARRASVAWTVKLGALLSNLTLLTDVIAFDAYAGAIMRPKAWMIISFVVLETLFSVRNLGA